MQLAWGPQSVGAPYRAARRLVAAVPFGPEREEGFDLLAQAREAAVNERFTMLDRCRRRRQDPSRR
jgi:hypothetical protein